MQGAEESDMIELNELTNEIEVSEQETADVKGGPAFMKLCDIKGEATEARSTGIVFVGGWGSSSYQY